MKNKINWTKFKGSSHCEEGLAEFAVGKIKSFVALEQYFLPHMKEQSQVVNKLKVSKRGINKCRKQAARAFKRFTGLSITEAYGARTNV